MVEAGDFKLAKRAFGSDLGLLDDFLTIQCPSRSVLDRLPMDVVALIISNLSLLEIVCKVK